MFRDLETLKDLMGISDPDVIQKALTVSSGFVGINLEATAKLMLPLYAGLRNRVPVDRPKQGGTQAIWRMQLGYGGFDFSANMGTAFAAVGGNATGTAVTIQADYRSQALKGEVDFEAIPMAQGFDEPLAVETSRVLATLLKLEELLTLGGNSVALPVAAGTGTPSAAAGAFGAGNWTVQIGALTLAGCLSNADSTAPSHSGESLPSAAIVVVVPGGTATYLDVTWAPVRGALGYKVYCGIAAGNAITYLCPKANLAYALDTPLTTTAITDDGTTYVGVNRIRITAPSLNTYQTVPIADATVQANAYDGLVNWVEKSTMYSVNLAASGTRLLVNGAGQALTNAAAGIVEFDRILQSMWSTWQISPTLIVASPQSVAHLTNKLAAVNSGFMYRVDITQERGKFTGGVFLSAYVNKFAATMLGDQAATIPVWSHPYMPDGTYLFMVERVPYQYSREARGFALDVLQPYTYFELARSARTIPFDIFFTQVLKCYHPLAQAALVGVRTE